MPANPQPEAYPVFAELCLTARDMEKRLLEVKQKKIGEAAGLADGFGMFPTEFGEYTFSYALSEAQKIERKLFTSNYQAALSAPSQEGQAQRPRSYDMDERQIESELHKFAAEDRPDLKQQKISEPARPGALSFGPLKLPGIFWKKPSQGAQTPQEAPPGSAGNLPQEIQIASEAESYARERHLQSQEAAPQKQAVGRDSIKIPLIPKKTPVPGELPTMPPPPPEAPQEEAQGEIAEKESGLEFVEEKPGESLQKEVPAPGPRGAASRKAAALQGGEEIPKHGAGALEIREKGPEIPKSHEEENEGIPLRDEEPPAQSKPEAAQQQSKIAPRLREIIEARLKKEEALSAQAKSAEEEMPQAASEEPPSEAQPQEEIIMSAHERMSKRRGAAPPAPPRKIEKKKGPASGVVAEKGEEPAPEEGEDGLEERPDSEQESGEAASEPGESGEDGGRKIEEELEPEPKAGGEEEHLHDESPAPSKGKRSMREEEPAPEPELKAAPGGLLIRPIFEGQGEEEGAQKPNVKAAEGPVEQERLRRIQKIIGELSADRRKAGATAWKEGEKEEAAPSKKKAKAAAHAAQEEETGPEPIPAEITEENIPKAKMAQKGKLAQAGKSAKAKTAVSQPKVPAQARKKAKGSMAGAKKNRGRPKQEREQGEGKPAAAAIAKKRGAVPLVRPVQEDLKREAPHGASRRPSQGKEGRGESSPFLSARERLLAAIEEKNKRNPEPLDEGDAEQPQPAQAGPKTRILPGGISVQQKGAMRTYVPPAREKIVPKMQAVQKGAPQEADEGPVPQEEMPQPRPPGRMSPMIGLVPKKLAKRQEPQGQSGAGGAGMAPGEGRQAPPMLPVRKQPPRQKEGAPEGGGGPQEEAPSHEEGEALPEEARKPPVKSHDLAGEAAFPQDADEDLEVPKPPSPEDGVPKPGEYEQAKEEFKRKLDQEEVRVNAKEESDEILEQYAKENLVWLYEIYKMGGISRDDFLQKVREKSSDSGGAATPGASPANPALAAIGKELEKKGKK